MMSSSTSSRKRQAVTNSNPDSVDSLFWNQRIMGGGSTFDVQRAKPLASAAPMLDMHRAELSRQHVRALNNQFASWVQTQLKNHPDELWEDGVRDYLSHALSITDNFSDVVNWIKANNSMGNNLSTAGLENSVSRSIPNIKDTIPSFLDKDSWIPTPPSSFSNSWSSGPSQNCPVSFGLTHSNNKPVAETKINEVNSKSSQENSVFTSSANVPGFANAWSSNLLSNSPAPIFAGFRNSGSAKPDDSNDKDDGEELEQPSSPSVKRAEEEGIIIVHEVKCKLYVKSTDPADKVTWKDKGPGGLTIKCKAGVSKGTKESTPTIIVRNNVGKVLLNALLYPGIKTSLQKNSIVAIFHSADNENDENVSARTFLIRTKSEEDRDILDAAIKEYCPS